MSRRATDDAESFEEFVQAASEPFPAHPFERVLTIPELCRFTRLLAGELKIREHCPFPADHVVHQVG